MNKEAMFYEPLPDGTVHCFLCAHHCRIRNHAYGRCRMRQNIDRTLYTYAYGAAIATHIDPVEKKPLYHFLPGTSAYSFGTVGCNFHCGFCQNWQISQAAEIAASANDFGRRLAPGEIVGEALAQGCASIAYTYTEPTIFFEYAYDVCRRAREKGVRNIFVTNGFMTAQALETIAPWLDAANVDLKAWHEDYYRKVCGGRLKPVLDTIRAMRRLGIWVEVTTLLIPGENDSREEMKGIASFLAEVDPDMPWHLSAFHPAYRFNDRASTPLETLQTAQEIGRRAGVRYIYLGNVPADNATICPHCGQAVQERRGRMAAPLVRGEGGKCPSCGMAIAGVWE